jgi:hypothetical protein
MTRSAGRRKVVNRGFLLYREKCILVTLLMYSRRPPNVQLTRRSSRAFSDLEFAARFGQHEHRIVIGQAAV